MRRALILVGLAGLVFAGVATAAVLTRTVHLASGKCVTISKTKVCAPPPHTLTVRRTTTVRGAEQVPVTVTSPPVTVTSPPVTVTSPPVTVTVTVQAPATPAPAPAPTPTPTPAPTPSPITLNFSGNGDLTEAPFTTTVGETLSWTWQNTNGNFPTGMTIFDDSQGTELVSADGQTTSGTTYVPAGKHTLVIITIGNWTISVHP